MWIKDTSNNIGAHLLSLDESGGLGAEKTQVPLRPCRPQGKGMSWCDAD